MNYFTASLPFQPLDNYTSKGVVLENFVKYIVV